MADVADPLRSLVHWPAALAQQLHGRQSPEERAAAVVALLHDLIPDAVVTACRLVEDEQATFALFPESRRPEGTGKLQALTLEPGEVRLLLPGAVFTDLLGIVASLPDSPLPGDFLFVAFPANTTEALAASMEGLLALAAALIGQRLRIAADCDRLQALRDEIKAQAEIVTVGDAMLGLTHDLSNSLNTMMLQAAVVQLKVDTALREDLSVIRREGATAAGSLRLLQDYRTAARRARERIDLHRLLREVVAQVPDLSERVRWQLATNMEPLLSNRSVLGRLLLRLCRLAADGLANSAVPLLIRTVHTDKKTSLILEPFLERTAAASLADLFTASPDMDQPNRVLEGLAAESLARLVETQCRIEADAHGGQAVTLEWTTNAVEAHASR